MTELNCNHECHKCPGWTLNGETNCIIINQVMKTARMETKIASLQMINETLLGQINERKKEKTNENV